jgi:hypothetical protein
MTTEQTRVDDHNNRNLAMLTYNNDATLKAEHVARAEAHLAADMLRDGTYGEGSGKNFRACSVGCFAHDLGATGNQHEAIANHYAIPEWLVRLQDSMFEGLPEDERGSFHVELARRIPLGVSLDPLPHLIAIARIDRMLVTQRKALEANHKHGVGDAIAQTIAALEVGRRAHEAAAGGDSCQLSAARSAAQSAAWSAESAAESAAQSAAWSAESAAWSAAESAAQSAAWSAESAAWSAAESAAESAARSAESAAWSAARSAAQSAADSAAESAAWSAARSAAWSAAWKQERDDLFTALDSLAPQRAEQEG